MWRKPFIRTRSSIYYVKNQQYGTTAYTQKTRCRLYKTLNYILTTRFVVVVNSKIRDSDWLTFALTIVNFNYVFIQSAPEIVLTWEALAKTCYEYLNAYVTLCSFLRVTVVNLDQMVRLDHQVPPVMLVLMVILVKMVKLELR